MDVWVKSFDDLRQWIAALPNEQHHDNKTYLCAALKSEFIEIYEFAPARKGDAEDIAAAEQCAGA